MSSRLSNLAPDFDALFMDQTFGFIPEQPELAQGSDALVNDMERVREGVEAGRGAVQSDPALTLRNAVDRAIRGDRGGSYDIGLIAYRQFVGGKG